MRYKYIRRRYVTVIINVSYSVQKEVHKRPVCEWKIEGAILRNYVLNANIGSIYLIKTLTTF